MIDPKLERKLTKDLKALQLKRQDNLKRIVEFPYKDLERKIDAYYVAHERNLELGHEMNAKIIWELYSQCKEALRIKRGNDEEIWDSLT